MNEVIDFESENQIISQEHKIWKKHVPFLYQTCSSYELPTCTQTVQFLDDHLTNQEVNQHLALIGTNSTGHNKLLLIKFQLPLQTTLCDNSEFKTDANIGQFGLKKLDIQCEISQPSEVIRARAKPKSKLVAVRCGGVNSEIHILDMNGLQSSPEPLLILEGHQGEGFGLEWNKIRCSYLASGGSDRKICVWDIEEQQEEAGVIKPTSEFVFHSQGVEDVSWSGTNPDLLASCGQDKLIAVWDLRQRKKKPEMQKTAHLSDVYAVRFNPFCDTLLLSAGEDSEIAMWDLRYFSKRVHTFNGHIDSVNTLKWSPTNRLQFASGSSDRSIIMWNVQEAGNPTQISFIHAGHQSRVLELDFNNHIPNTVVSSQQCNLIQIWCPSWGAFQRPKPESKMDQQ